MALTKIFLGGLRIDGDVVIGPAGTDRITIGGGTNDNGIVFGSLGTATKGIDLENSGLSGASDYLFYFDADNSWTAAGVIKCEGLINQDNAKM